MTAAHQRISSPASIMLLTPGIKHCCAQAAARPALRGGAAKHAKCRAGRGLELVPEISVQRTGNTRWG